MDKFCPKCGKTKGAFVKGFCVKCYASDHKLVELDEILSIPVCKRCGRIMISGKWHEFSLPALADFIKSKTKTNDFEIKDLTVDYEEADETKNPALVNILGSLDGMPYSLSKAIIIQKENKLCDGCMKASSNYYDVILQVRFDSMPNAKKAVEIFREVMVLANTARKENPAVQITNVSKTKNGTDFFIVSKQGGKFIADKLAKKHKSQITRSYSVKGIDSSGKPKKKFTFCVRV